MAEKRPYNNKRQNQSPIIAANEFGKLPPQAPELEEAVLGAIMLETDAYSMVSEILKPECFYKIAHQRIFEAIQSLAVHQQPVDMHTVTEQLRKDGTIDEVNQSLNQVMAAFNSPNIYRISRSAGLNLKYLRKVDRSAKICIVSIKGVDYEESLSRKNLDFLERMKCFPI